MEDVAFVLVQGPEINIRIIDKQLNAFKIPSEDCVMQGCVTFLTLEVYIIWVSYFLQYELNIEINALIAGQHQRSHSPPIKLLQISPTLKQNTQILAIC